MGTELIFIAVILLAAFAVFDLTVGVSNDAVNFLNSSIGSRVAPRWAIMIVASLGIIAGVTFSSGMMEVARKGIFHPEFFTLPELLTIFLAVMLTDIILLDLFNTFGLPTSTTVSIVFELLGGAVAVSLLKIAQLDESLASLGQYINTGRALMIIFGILLSVAVAFIFGALAQFLSRLVFTFDYKKRLNRYGAIWGGVALASITYFILVKGARGASFIGPETVAWIKSNTVVILLAIFAVSAVLLQILLALKVNILKPIVLIGTFALALAFAANDLVNFIGVPMAGYHGYKAAVESGSPLTAPMGALAEKVPAETYLLLLAGLIMVITLWFSKKARTVADTEISLGQQDEGEERFESAFLARVIVRMAIGLSGAIERIIPHSARVRLARRFDTSHYQAAVDDDQRPSFDMLRAGVNLMVASAVISYATSYKLPLSTTYVTFMVAMGTSFADLAWGRESAVYRVTGVLTVIGGWFMTALLAFTISAVFAVVIFYGQAYGVLILLGLAALAIWKDHHTHGERARLSEMEKVFNLKKVTNLSETVSTTFEHMGYLLHEIHVSLDATLEGLFQQNEYLLRAEKRKTKKIQRWANIIIANIFKSMRLMQKEEMELSYKYGQTIRELQKLADGHRDIVMRSYLHVSNHHKGLLDVQVRELEEVKHILHEILSAVETMLSRKRMNNFASVIEKDKELRQLAERLNQDQMERIRNGASKTRLSILFYAIVENAIMLSTSSLKLLEIFEASASGAERAGVLDQD